jgi:hypothetical protein
MESLIHDSEVIGLSLADGQCDVHKSVVLHSIAPAEALMQHSQVLGHGDHDHEAAFEEVDADALIGIGDHDVNGSGGGPEASVHLRLGSDGVGRLEVVVQDASLGQGPLQDLAVVGQCLLAA